ncbi:Uncharacterised protein [Vibrio cholerae]|nr:Uncharacterised protein [Vibrio cholerae]CSI69222.1 Uncharacterised protein [Vibrio cholerae]
MRGKPTLLTHVHTKCHHQIESNPHPSQRLRRKSTLLQVRVYHGIDFREFLSR